MVMTAGPLSIRGTIVWLTPQQGGRAFGPPAPNYDSDYTATAHVPPRTARDGSVGIALRQFAPGAWRSPAEGCLVAGEGTRSQPVWPGCLVVVTEGERAVGFFTVEAVEPLENSTTDLAPRATPATAPVPAVPVRTPLPTSVAVRSTGPTAA